MIRPAAYRDGDGPRPDPRVASTAGTGGPSREVGLRGRIVEEAGRVLGCEEHLQFSRLARSARAYSLDAALVADLARTVVLAPIGIERNLDVIDVPPEGLWIEWDDRARGDARVAAPGTVRPDMGGALLCRDPDDPDRLVVMTAWSLPNGSVRHSYAAIALSRADLAGHAWLARNRFSAAPVESSYRLLMNVHVYIPPGLAEELEIMGALEEGASPARLDEVREGARRDVTADAIFVLASVLSLRADGIAARDVEGGPTICSLAPRPRGRLRSLVDGFRRPGLGRRGKNADARVFYVPWDGVQRGAGA